MKIAKRNTYEEIINFGGEWKRRSTKEEVLFTLLKFMIYRADNLTLDKLKQHFGNHPTIDVLVPFDDIQENIRNCVKDELKLREEDKKGYLNENS